ncbi:MAG: hypothetical protein KJZ85_10690 [Rhodobacteraceae bacterium]|jgi:xylulokinase|nr:hypothetical protein [Paracoccaceae bacterium]
MRYVIGLDMGSGSIRAGAFGLDGRVAAMAARPSVSATPDPARPDHIVWPHAAVWEAAAAVLREACAALPAGSDILGVAVATLGMDGLPVGHDGAPLYDFIAWTDGRCKPHFDAWARDFGEERQFLATGTPARSFSTLFRLQWMADHHPEIMARTRKWVLMGDFINFRLCGELATDLSMAACTLLYDPAAGRWHEGIAAAAGVDTRLMCTPRPAGTVLGRVTAAAAAATGLPAGTPVILGGHDYLCGALPVGGHRPGTVVNVGGTWDIIQATLPAFSLPEAAVGTGWTIEPHVAPGLFSAFGAAIGGAVTAWFRRAFAPDLDDAAFAALATRAAAAGASGGVLFLPHLAGATGPVVDPDAAGAFIGLRPGHGRAELLAAVFEGLNLQTREILASATAFGLAPEQLVFVGGSSRNPGLVQAKADALGLPVEVPDVAETTALGAALLAALGAGAFAGIDEAVDAMRPATSRTLPDPGRAGHCADRLALFRAGFTALRNVHAALARAGAA